MSTESSIRFLTYLAPSIPLTYFELLVAHVGRTLGVSVTLQSETRFSGPTRAEADPFSTDRVDVAFMCSPSYLWLRDRTPVPAELVRAAAVSTDPRAGGNPVYFSDVIVRRDAAIQRFAQLRNAAWSYNDTCSLSGYYTLLRKLDELGADRSFFADIHLAGSHLHSIDRVISGESDAAAIDSNVLIRCLREHPELDSQVRVIETWGPYPVQPLVVRTGLDAGLKRALAATLIAMHENAATHAQLVRHGVDRFVDVDDSSYEAEREALQACERLASREHMPEPVG